MAEAFRNRIAHLATVVLAACLCIALSGCVKQTSEDAEILNDAGTASNAAIVLDPDESSSSR